MVSEHRSERQRARSGANDSTVSEHRSERQRARSGANDGTVSARDIAGSVADPELPMLTIADLGILRDVAVAGGRAIVTITPTYSGCPAMGAIRADVTAYLHRAGFADVEVRTSLRPAWSSDWITAEGRHKLAESGIAPPGPAPSRPVPGHPVPLTLTRRAPHVRCPRCGSPDTVETSAFGATACKALRRCNECAEPFEQVKAF
jgi:ring-1,2-phenylacetyl-CoA epoxidase subunit PaaD